jgi:hypothetical protein
MVSVRATIRVRVRALVMARVRFMRWWVGCMKGLAGATSRRVSTYPHESDRGRVPGRDVAVEAGCVIEQVLHGVDRARVPGAYVPVGARRRSLVVEPLGHSLLESAAGERRATAQAQHQVQGRLLLDVVVREGAAVLELLAREDQALLVGGGAILVLDLGLDVVDAVRRLHL